MKVKFGAFVLAGVMALSIFAFVPESPGAIVWATDVVDSSNVNNPGYALGAPDPVSPTYASINAPFGYLTVGFGTDFLDLTGPDVVVVDAVADWASVMNIKIGDVYTLQARRVADLGWSGLTWDSSTGGWRLLDIAGTYAGAYDQIRLTYILGPNWTLEVDAIGVKNPASPVPEPSTLMLLGSGLVGIAGFGLKKSRRRSA